MDGPDVGERALIPLLMSPNSTNSCAPDCAAPPTLVLHQQQCLVQQRSIVREENGGEWRQNGADLAAVLCLSDWLARWQFGNTEHQTQTTEQQTTTSPQRERETPLIPPPHASFIFVSSLPFPLPIPITPSLANEWYFCPKNLNLRDLSWMATKSWKYALRGNNSGSNQAGRKPGEICYPDVLIVSHCILWVLCIILYSLSIM